MYFLLLLVLGFMWFIPRARHGRNSVFSLTSLNKFIMSGRFEEIHAKYKSFLNSLDKNAFAKFKIRGILAKKKALHEVSRGCMKIRDLLRQTKIMPSGTVLSLACGRGGWEQEIAQFAAVINIISVTLGSGPGHEGHEDFTTSIWIGREKVRLINADITVMHKTLVPRHDMLLFDGGESRSTTQAEADKFYRLFHEGVMPYISANTQQFILKILVPFDPRVIADMEQIRRITGKGNLFLSVLTRQSTMEMYFCSTPMGGDLRKQARELMANKITRAIMDDIPDVQIREREHTVYRQNISPDVRLLQPMDMSESIRSLGSRLVDVGRQFNHWVSLGVYPFGSGGTKHTPRVMIIWGVINALASKLPQLSLWGATDATPMGLFNIFARKVDTAPVENSEFFVRLGLVYNGLSKYFMSRGYVHTSLSWQEILAQANKQGARGVNDKHVNVGQALSDPCIQQTINEHEKALLNGRPINCIFNVMSKREKKKNASRGSRMVAFLGIVMRIIELKFFGRLAELVKPHMNRFAVGGLGVHDLGMRLREIYTGWSIADDVAGFDTRIGLKIQSLEYYAFIRPMIRDEYIARITEALYRVYAYPHILLPMVGKYVRSELLSGVGHRMSGTWNTYTMNTITRLAITLLQILVVEKIPIDGIVDWVVEMMEGRTDRAKKWAAAISGDDQVVMGNPDDIRRLSESVDVTNSLGMIRKDIPLNSPSIIRRTIEEVEFCSHQYRPVTYYDEFTGAKTTRWMPVRPYGEIFGKASIWIRATEGVYEQSAWAFAQANNLLVNYAHMRDCRRLGLAIRSIVPQNIVLIEKARTYLMPKPWMTSGDMLEVMNRCYFGDSTAYPVPGFRVHKWSHMGYIPLNAEYQYNQEFSSDIFIKWRDRLNELVVSMALRYGGNGSDLRLIGRHATSVQL